MNLSRTNERIIQRLDKKFDNKYNEGYNKILLADAEHKTHGMSTEDSYHILDNERHNIRYIGSFNKGYTTNSLSYADQETLLEKYVRNIVEKSVGKKKYFMDEEDKELYEDTLIDLISKQNELNIINNYINRIKEDEEEYKKLIDYFNEIATYLSGIGIILCFLRFKKKDKDIDSGIKRKNKKTKRKSIKNRRKNKRKSAKRVY